MCLLGRGAGARAEHQRADGDAAVAPAIAAVKGAAERVAASAREQALIAALAKRYRDDPKAERAALDAAYAEAMGEVAERFPRTTTSRCSTPRR